MCWDIVLVWQKYTVKKKGWTYFESSFDLIICVQYSFPTLSNSVGFSHPIYPPPPPNTPSLHNSFLLAIYAPVNSLLSLKPLKFPTPDSWAETPCSPRGCRVGGGGGGIGGRGCQLGCQSWGCERLHIHAIKGKTLYICWIMLVTTYSILLYLCLIANVHCTTYTYLYLLCISIGGLDRYTDACGTNG